MYDVNMLLQGLRNNEYYDFDDSSMSGGRIRFYRSFQCVGARGETWSEFERNYPNPFVVRSPLVAPEARSLCEKVIQSVRLALHYGAANNTAHRENESQIKVQWRVMGLCRPGSEEYLAKIGVVIGDATSWPIEDSVLAAHACIAKSGNCGEFAACAFTYLAKYACSARVVLVKNKNHCFTVVFFGTNNSIVVDPWVLYPRICPAAHNYFPFDYNTTLHVADVYSGGFDMCTPYYNHALSSKTARKSTKKLYTGPAWVRPDILHTHETNVANEWKHLYPPVRLLARNGHLGTFPVDILTPEGHVGKVIAEPARREVDMPDVNAS